MYVGNNCWRKYIVSTELDTLSSDVLRDRGMMKRRETQF